MSKASRILFINELVTMLRAPANIFFIFIFPLFFLWIMLFSYGSQGTLGPVTVETVDYDRSASSADYIGRIRKMFENGTLITGEVIHGDPARPLESGRIRLVVPEGFEKALLSNNDARVKVEYNAANNMSTQFAARIFDPLTLRFNVDSLQSPVPIKLEFKNSTGQAAITFPQYLVTGILIMSMMSTAIFSTALIVAVRREQNTFKLMSCMPMSAGNILASIVAARGLVIVISAMLLLMLAVPLFGLELDLTARKLLNALGLVAVGGAMLISLGLMVSARLASVQGAIFAGNLIYIALLFLSDLAVPLHGAGTGPLSLLLLLPTSQFVSGLRSILVQDESFLDQWRHVLIMLAWAATFILIARATFRWHKA